MWIALFLAAGWLTTLLYLLIKGQRKPAAKSADSADMPLKQSLKALKKACTDNDALAAKDALLAWGRLKYKLSSLGAIAPHCDARLRDEIIHLNQCLYGKNSESWEGKKLFQSFVENKAMEGVKTETDNTLEPLYRL